MIGRGITIPGYGSEKFQKENILRLLKMDMYPAKYCGSVHDVGEFDDEKEKIERALPRLFNLTTVIGPTHSGPYKLFWTRGPNYKNYSSDI